MRFALCLLLALAPAAHAARPFMSERLQVDATLGRQHATPIDRNFYSVGLRVLW